MLLILTVSFGQYIHLFVVSCLIFCYILLKFMLAWGEIRVFHCTALTQVTHGQLTTHTRVMFSFVFLFPLFYTLSPCLSTVDLCFCFLYFCPLSFFVSLGQFRVIIELNFCYSNYVSFFFVSVSFWLTLVLSPRCVFLSKSCT